MNIGFYGYYQFSTNYADTSATHLNALRRNFFLTNDIDLSSSTFSSGLGWVPIGNDSTPFVGKFNGLNYKIKGLTINRGASYQGLFGEIRNANIRNIVLENVSITIPVNTNDPATFSLIGGLAGYSVNSTIDNVRVYSSNNITSTVKINVVGVPTTSGVFLPSSIGGIVGHSSDSNISNVVFVGNVIGATEVGGIAGHFRTNAGANRTLSKARVIGNITAGRFAGGLVGNLYQVDISMSSFEGAISLNVGGNGQATFSQDGSNFGSLVGFMSLSSIANSYAVSTISNTGRYVGGFVGFISTGSITNSYVDVTINSLNPNPLNNGAIVGDGTNLAQLGLYYNVVINGTLDLNSTSDANMKLQSTYVGWNTSIWRFDGVNLPQHIYN
jgi:hypothetical protein